MRKLFVASLSLAVALSAFADANVREKTQIHFGGFLGGVINVFGGKATREGLESNTIVKGNRMVRTTGSSAQIVDLGEEKIYQLDYDRHTYTVKTFAELRKEIEDAQERAKRSQRDEKPAKKSDAPEYEVDFEMKNTGNKQTINGFATREVIAIVTVRQKGKTLEQGGGAVLTSDMWMGPKVAAMHEVGDFERRYFQKLYGGTSIGADMQQMAVLMATSPAFAKAMKTFSEKRSSFEGTPIRTTLTVDTVANPNAEQNDQQAAESSSPGAVIGGLMGRLKKRQAERNQAEGENRNRLFESTTELLNASTSATSTDVAIPAGFKLRS